MKSIRLIGIEKGRVALEEFDTPLPCPGEVVVKTEWTLVSAGTERAFLLGLENALRPFPMRIGYNQAGTIMAVGDGVTAFAIGDRVATNGNHASHTTANTENVFRLPDNLTLDHAVFFNMIGIALQGIRKASVETGDGVLVLGLGMVGQLALQCAGLQGGFPLLAADVSDKRLALAKLCGADFTFNLNESVFEKKLAAATSGKGPSVVIEATGSPAPVNTAFQLAARGGRVVLLASTRGETERVNFYRDVHLKGLTILGAHNNVRPEENSTAGYWTWRDDAELVLRLLAAKRFSIEPLVSHRVGFTDAPDLYNKHLLQWNEDVMGVLIDWK